MTTEGSFDGRSAVLPHMVSEGVGAVVRVKCLCPGPVETPLVRRSEILLNTEDPDWERRRLEAGTPLGRYASPREVAETAMSLLRGDVAYQTGSAVVIDGGITSA